MNASHQSSLQYRPDIDGIRAVAVLSVLLFHAGFSSFTGGYVGVDVFFVISGYLITGIIKKELESTGKFDYSRFYVRRVRRLFPAMFAVLAATSIASYWLFAPTYFAEFCGSLLHAIVSLSNIYFWWKVSYFDLSATLKPLLHTWSLSVEEQFYLVWPVLLVALFRYQRRRVALWLCAIGLISLALNFFFQDGWVAQFFRPAWLAEKLQDGRSAIFYLTPFRVFEFAIGAGLLWIPKIPSQNSRVLPEVILTVGLISIAISVFWFTEETLFPSYNALLPCLGTALLIYSGQAKFAGIILRNPVSVGIGKISYSLYLVHWPIIVFYGYVSAIDEIGDKLAICLASVVLATLLYFFVEQPFRRQTQGSLSGPAFGLASSALAILLMVPAANAWANNGWMWRYPEAIAQQMAVSQEELNTYTHRLKRQIDTPFPNSGKITMLIIGDSMAGDFTNLVHESGIDEVYDVRAVGIDSPCFPLVGYSDEEIRNVHPNDVQKCRYRIKKATKALVERSPDIVVFASYWRDPAPNYIGRSIDFAYSKGAKSVYVVGSKAIAYAGMRILSKNAWKSDLSGETAPVNDDLWSGNELMKQKTESHKGHFLDFYSLLCSSRRV